MLGSSAWLQRFVGCAIGLSVCGLAGAQTTLVSTGADGTQGNGSSGLAAAISADGRIVAFASAASNQ